MLAQPTPTSDSTAHTTARRMPSLISIPPLPESYRRRSISPKVFRRLAPTSRTSVLAEKPASAGRIGCPRAGNRPQEHAVVEDVTRHVHRPFGRPVPHVEIVR